MHKLGFPFYMQALQPQPSQLNKNKRNQYTDTKQKSFYGNDHSLL